MAVACAGQPHGAPTRVIIPRGASFGQATDSLAGAVVLPHRYRQIGRPARARVLLQAKQPGLDATIDQLVRRRFEQGYQLADWS